MDYNIRAARAGFLGVWACAAYVHRAPFTARRRIEEAQRFEASRHRYQDKFCARRLRGERGAYEPHCMGEDCVEFAPSGLIRIRELLAAEATTTAHIAATTTEATSATATTTATATARVAALSSAIAATAVVSTIAAAATSATPAIATTALTPEAPPASAAAIAASDHPLVLCIMPTRNRRAWVPQAIRYFLRQDFTDAELVILDDGDDPVRDCVPAHPRIRYQRLDGRRTIGAKRNLACAEARGELIAHWDDDDWYPPSRLRRQFEGLRASGADVCGTSQLYFYQPSAGHAWRYHHTSPGVPMLVGTSLLYRRRMWERTRFADIQISEDVRFVRSGAGALRDLADPALCVATIHDGNTSPRNPDALFWRSHPSADIRASAAAYDGSNQGGIGDPPAGTGRCHAAAGY